MHLQRHVKPSRLSGAVRGVVSPAWLVGPIFEKELRVSARRRRNYVLRFVYLAVMAAFISLIWIEATESFGYISPAFRASRMWRAGQQITAAIIGGQFVATQLIAVIMLSTAVSEEVRRRTLGVLLTTPISSLQIIMGKLLSKLWQLIVLMAISMPLLAIVQVFGGVVWEFVISGLCITLTSVIAAGSVSLYFSIRSRRASGAIFQTLVVGGLVYILLPVLVIMVVEKMYTSRAFETALVVMGYVNPFMAGTYVMEVMLNPGGIPVVFYWPLHCAAMLAISAFWIMLSVRALRKVSLRQAAGGLRAPAAKSKSRGKKVRRGTSAAGLPPKSTGLIRPVGRWPVLWRELGRSRSGKRSKGALIILILLGLILGYSYLHNLIENDLDDDEIQVAYAAIFVILGILSTAVKSADSITSEKESRSWPILLGTTLSDWHIVIGKAVGVFRKCIVVWLLLIGHVVVFSLLGVLHPIAILHVVAVAVWVTAFLTGSGLWLSARCRRTTTAVVMNLVMGFALWMLLPLLVALVCEVSAFSSRSSDAPFEWMASSNPVVQTVVVVEGAVPDWAKFSSLYSYLRSGRPKMYYYDWPDDECRTISETTGRILIYWFLYVLAGFVLLSAAKSRLRKNIF